MSEINIILLHFTHVCSFFELFFFWRRISPNSRDFSGLNSFPLLLSPPVSPVPYNPCTLVPASTILCIWSLFKFISLLFLTLFHMKTDYTTMARSIFCTRQIKIHCTQNLGKKKKYLFYLYYFFIWFATMTIFYTFLCVWWYKIHRNRNICLQV